MWISRVKSDLVCGLVCGTETQISGCHEPVDSYWSHRSEEYYLGRVHGIIGEKKKRQGQTSEMIRNIITPQVNGFLLLIYLILTDNSHCSQIFSWVAIFTDILTYLVWKCVWKSDQQIYILKSGVHFQGARKQKLSNHGLFRLCLLWRQVESFMSENVHRPQARVLQAFSLLTFSAWP